MNPGTIAASSISRPRGLRQAPPGHYVQVITNGFGAMYSYSDRVNMDDRWRIAAYIRALQLSQHAQAALESQPVSPCRDDDRRLGSLARASVTTMAPS